MSDGSDWGLIPHRDLWYFAAQSKRAFKIPIPYERGDYATALEEWRPLAEQGNAGVRENVLGRRTRWQNRLRL